MAIFSDTNYRKEPRETINKQYMNVLVNGIGNIGTTLLNLLVEYKDQLGINTIYALKNTPQSWLISDLQILQEKEVEIVSRDNNDFSSLDSIIDHIHYVFDCTNNGGGIANKNWYERIPNLKGACAQGSEKNFGMSYMIGVNDELIRSEKFAHIVSCNTHSIAAILSSLTDHSLSSLDQADFVIVRRSEDIGNHQRLVTANVVARHLDQKLGTHHSIDVLDLYKTMNISFNVTSSDVTTPSQLMHGVRFNVTFKNDINAESIAKKWSENPFVATTDKFDSNLIFELGRRYGFNGRIYSHAVVVANNLLIEENSVKGWAFIPQEGNTLLSTISAFLLQTNPEKKEKVMNQLTHDLLRNDW